MRYRLAACWVFLLLLLPLQMGWAGMHVPAAQQSTQAGVGLAASHCRHVLTADRADTSLAQVQMQAPMQMQADHGHCGSCHGAIALLAEAPRRFAGAPFAPVPAAARWPASQPAGLPDRPQWAARG